MGIIYNCQRAEKRTEEMKIKDLFKHIASTNKLQEELQSKERASVQIYVDDIEYGHECHTLKEFEQIIKTSFTQEFVEQLMNANFVETYNNTLSATLEFKYYCSGDTFTEKVDLFVDMGGF